MSHISIFQPEEGFISSKSTPLPPSFIALKEACASSQTLLPSLDAFLRGTGPETLAKLMGPGATEVADFFDTVCGPDLTIISGCG